MKTNQENNLVSWDDHLDRKYGKAGTPSREKYEEEFENFKIVTYSRGQKTTKPDIGRTCLKMWNKQIIYFKN